MPRETLQGRGNNSPQQGHPNTVLCGEEIGEQPLATIGLLTYNNEDTLVRSLDSLVQQDYANKEILIFDDCSTDGTYEICQDYAKRFSFIRLFRNERNVGCFENLKRLIRHTQEFGGEFFLWACPDDWYAESFITRHVGYLLNNPDIPAVLSATELIFTGKGGKPIPHHPKNRTDRFQALQLKDHNTFRGRFSAAKGLINGTAPSYCLFIHGLIRQNTLSIYLQNAYFFSIEELFPVFLFYQGGLGALQEVLYVKYQSAIPLETRHAQAAKVAYGWRSKLKCIGSALYFIWTGTFSIRQRIELSGIVFWTLKKYTSLSLRTSLYPLLGPLYRKLKARKNAFCIL